MQTAWDKERELALTREVEKFREANNRLDEKNRQLKEQLASVKHKGAEATVFMRRSQEAEREQSKLNAELETLKCVMKEQQERFDAHHQLQVAESETLRQEKAKEVESTEII